MTYDELEIEALKLAPREREALMLTLLASLESLDDFEPEQLAEWARRDAEMDADPSKRIPAAEALARLRARLGG